MLTDRATKTFDHSECTMYRESDFIELLPCKAALPANMHGEINAIDLTQTVQAAALFPFLHLPSWLYRS